MKTKTTKINHALCRRVFSPEQQVKFLTELPFVPAVFLGGA